MSNLTIKVEGLDRLTSNLKSVSKTEIQSEFRQAMVESTNWVKNRAQDIVAYLTGTLRRSIQARVENGGLRGLVYQDASIAPYGEAIEKGRRALTIVPVKKQALYWKGAAHPMKSVFQPARAAKPFMAPALQQSAPHVRGFFGSALTRIANRLVGKG